MGRGRFSVMNLPTSPGPIGVFDSGYGGLTILDAIRRHLPEYDYLYLGDNARAPYGSRSFELVYTFTRQAVYKLFEMGCHLIILACNTASAKALRSIQQHDLPLWDKERRVLGVIRPTVEALGSVTHNGHVGILATEGTIRSESYAIEIRKMYPQMKVSGEACPFWVPLVEYGEVDSEGADYFVRKRIGNILSKDPLIDTLILGCTHYPLLLPKIELFAPTGTHIMAQGMHVAKSLQQYLLRHPEMDARCTRGSRTHYLTTEQPETFQTHAHTFLRTDVRAEHIDLE